ncbi:hypothetical protein BC829DRAFT_394572 [Chytridium lagenaria]|nr:hypothetical protein BC829DRAFT_394572 [Chytridium lagenaria]
MKLPTPNILFGLGPDALRNFFKSGRRGCFFCWERIVDALANILDACCGFCKNLGNFDEIQVVTIVQHGTKKVKVDGITRKNTRTKVAPFHGDFAKDCVKVQPKIIALATYDLVIVKIRQPISRPPENSLMRHAAGFDLLEPYSSYSVYRVNAGNSQYPHVHAFPKVVVLQDDTVPGFRSSGPKCSIAEFIAGPYILNARRLICRREIECCVKPRVRNSFIFSPAFT